MNVPMPEPIIKAEGLTKTFLSRERKKGAGRKKKEVQALKAVNLEVLDGEVFGLLGPNGAGKTTLIKILTTLLLPTGGTAWVNGYNITKEENEVRASIGCMLMGDRGLYWKLTGRENLDYFGALYHVPKADRAKRIEYLIDLLKLGDFIDRTVETYSSGQRMIVAFAKSLVNDAPIMFLDEPTVTMDVPTARELRRIVKALNDEGKTILYTTHLMHEAEELCDRVAIIDHGEIIALGTPQELKDSLSHEDVVSLEGIFPEATVSRLRAVPGILDVAVTAGDGGRTKLDVMVENSRAMLPRIIEAVTGNGAIVEEIRPKEVTLEDVFVAKTGRTLAVDTRVVGEKAVQGRGG
jgi:ABC-2 type transport system ATP-binding protein